MSTETFTPLPPDPDMGPGRRWMVTKRPKENERHECKMPGRWERRSEHVTPGTLIRCLDCNRYWCYLGANDWQEQTADGSMISRYNVIHRR